MAENPATSTDFFGDHAARWLRLYDSKPSFKDRLELFSASLSEALPSYGRILDFGCGPGVMALALAEQGYDVLGVDGADSTIETPKMKIESGSGSEWVGHVRAEHSIANETVFQGPSR